MGPTGWPPLRSAGRSAFQCPGGGIDSLRRGSSLRETGTYSGAAIQRVSASLVVEQAEHDRVGQSLPRRLDDVVGDADRRPGALAVGAVDEDARDGARALGGVEDPHLVVGQVYALEHRE